MIKLKQILLESAHRILFSNAPMDYVSYTDDDAVAFSSENNKWKFADYHYNITDNGKYNGRYWSDSDARIMSFWEYPTDKKIILNLVKKLKGDINKMRIEVIYNKDNSLITSKYEIRKATQQLEDLYEKYIDADEVDYYPYIMPLKEYIGKYCK